jgi:ribosomal protein L11 methylase PrmA
VSPAPSGASFRDPSGFVFFRDGVVHRQVQGSYRAEYDHLVGSGLYDELAGAGLLVPHREVPVDAAMRDGAYRVLQPDPVPFVSYPYEWCFSQLRDAAVLTLEIQRRALARGMILKDATAFNVQFIGSRPIFLDTLSFARYREGEPWVAYHQFCQHFLAPLLLMSRVDVRLARLLCTHLDGIPLDLASSLLPRRTWLRPAWLTHVHLHAQSVKRFAQRQVPTVALSKGVSRRGLEGLVDHLERAIQGLSWKARTQWSDYDLDHGYDADAFDFKRGIVLEMIQGVAPGTVWDLGANTGVFSRIAAECGALVIALEADAGAAERHYRDVSDRQQDRVLPLWLDVTNPPPALGWGHSERMSLEERGPADLLMALALVHHLAISNNVPLRLIADWFARLTRCAIVEFVPKEDPQTRRLLTTRKDTFDDYEQSSFEKHFSRHFRILRSAPVVGTQRVLYLMQKTGDGEAM